MSNNKRKGEDKSKKSPKTLKRAGTMDVTAQEGKEFLEQEAPDLVKTPKGKEGVETRGKTQARAAINSLLSSSKKLEELTEGERKKEESKLKMVFRLFDKDNDNYLDAEELAAALRTCGKKPNKDKIKKIIASISQKKANKISGDEFVAYMMKKQFKAKPEPEKPAEKEKEKEKEKEVKKEKETPTKGKKGAAAKKGAEKEKEKESETKKEPKGKEKAPETKKEEKGKEKVPEPEKLGRTRSITEFYTEHAGMNTEITAEQLDKFSNPAGVEFDLGVEGAFNGFKILIGSFCNEFTFADWESNPKPPLQNKGFEFIHTTNEAEFINKLGEVDVAWVVSSRNPVPNKEKFVKACRDFHQAGGGLYIWGDNDPYYQHANAILQDLIQVTLTGNTTGDKTLEFGEPKAKGKFGAHLITSGITKLYEGVTISYPAKESVLRPIATSTDGNPVVLAAEPGDNGLKEGCGRIVVDCGFTKLFHKWDTAGTARYVVNANVWLVGLDYRMRQGLPVNRREGQV